MKSIAMYLPQYHEVEENSKWWGKGFTEWDTVKSAECLFENHVQPHIPLNKYYYDLTDKETLKWQSELMKKYGIDGMCFYHYWFENGRKILEKPSEKLLEWSDIDMPFCFCWANESWVRSWSKYCEGNVWADKFEKDSAGNKEVLLKQRYGSIEDWKEHFTYLCRFFKDRRYIKIDERPVFLIYKPVQIVGIRKMIKLWNDMAVQAGLNGIYVIGMNSENIWQEFDAVLCHEPQGGILRCIASGCKKENDYVYGELDYKSVWENILEYQSKGDKVFYGGFTGYDDTPRRGKKGTVITGMDVKSFEKYILRLFIKNYEQGNELLFINAWNEWGEGMHMEPDEQNKYDFLEAFYRAKKDFEKQVNVHQNIARNNHLNLNKSPLSNCGNKYEVNCRILDKWLRLKENNMNIADCLLEKNIRRIGIYGIGMMGQHLMSEFHKSDIEIICYIDKNTKVQRTDICIISPSDEIPQVDAIIVSVAYLYDDIYAALRDKTDCDIISIDYLLNEY